MDGYELEMTQVIHAPEESEDEDDDREVRAVLKVQLEDTPPKFQTFNLKPGANIVGRSHSCDLMIDIPGVSKQHALIELSKSDIIITDLGSRNGVKIGKRTLQPHVRYNLDYNKEFSVAGLKARILRDEQNGAGGDADSDTCSESLLTAVEVAQDQAGAEVQAAAPETSTVACDNTERTGNVASELGPNMRSAVNKATTDASACNSATQSSGSFTLPEMPNLDFTQTDSSGETEPCGGDGKAATSSGNAEAAVLEMSIGGGSNAVVTSDKDAFLCAPTQGFPDTTQESRPGDASALGGANATVQPYTDYTECSEAPHSRRDEVASVEVAEADRLNAPTQGFDDTAAAQPPTDGTEYPVAQFSAHDEMTEAAADEVDRLNAPTQGFADDAIALLDDTDKESHLNAATQPYSDDTEYSKAPHSSHGEIANAEVDEIDRLNAPTQGFSDDTADGLTAAILAPAACASLDEQEKLNAVTQSIDDHSLGEAGTEDISCAPTQPGDRPRRLLSGPSDLSFVLCEASQPCRDDEEDDEYCPPTQKDTSPALKVHALLKHGKEKHQASVHGGDDNDETPPLSPKTTVDETPPPSPGFVAESDPEDNSASMVTAPHSLSALDLTGTTLYEDCPTPDNSIGSPVIGMFGRVSAKRRRSGMSLRKKPFCDIAAEQASLEAVAEAEYQQESVPSKASKKLDYPEQAQVGDGGSSTAASTGISTVPCLKEAEEASKPPADNTGVSLPSPAKGRSSTASVSPSEKDDDALYLHMSEIEGLDVPATEQEGNSGPCQRSATLEESTNAAEGRTESDKVVGTTVSPAIEKTPEQPCSREEVPEKDEPSEVSSDIEEESKTASRRKGKNKQTSKTSRTRKKASKSDVGDSTAEATGAPARRSSGRQNAGSRMKSLLSLEKRTSASGNFREGGLSQEVSDKQDALHDVAENAQDKVAKRGLRRGQKGKGATEEQQEVASPASHREPSPDASSHEKDVEEHSLQEGEAKCDQRSPVADQDEEHMIKEVPAVASEDKHVEDRVEIPSSPVLECKLDCTNATVGTGFSEPFTPFSQIMKDCLAASEDSKTEQVEDQRHTTTDTKAMDQDKATSSPVHLEQEPVAERRRQALRSTANANNGPVTRKRKEPAAKTSFTRRKATRRNVQEISLQIAEVLAEDTPREVEESEAAQQRSTRAAKRGRLSRNKTTKKAASELEVLSTIPETEQPESGSEADSLSAHPLEHIDEKVSEAPETSLTSQEDRSVSQPSSSKTSRRGVKKTKVAQAGADTAAGNAEQGEQKGGTASQPGRRGTRTRSTRQGSESQNESTLDVSLKSDLESIQSLSPGTSRRGRRGEKLSQEQNSNAHINDAKASSQPEPEAVRDIPRRGRGTRQSQSENISADGTVVESTSANSCTETESQDSKTSRRRGRKAPASSQEKRGEVVISTGGNVSEESCVEHQLEETAGSRQGRKRTRLPPKKRGRPVVDTAAESPLESDNAEADEVETLPQSGRTSTRLSQRQRGEESSKEDVDVVKGSPNTPEPQTTRSSQRKRSASLSQENKALSEQTAAAGPAKRSLKTEPVSPAETNLQPSSASTQQGQSQETGRRGRKNVAKVPSKSKQETVESELEHSPKVSNEPPKARPGRRQASEMPAPAQAPVTRKRDARRIGKQGGAPSAWAASTVETLEETSFLCSPPKVSRKKRHVASISFGESREESDDDETTANEEETLEEMQIKLEPKSRRKAPVKEPAVKQEVVEGPPTKRGKRKGSLPEVVPMKPRRSISQEGEDAGASSTGTPKTLKRKPKVLFTGIDCTDEEEQVVRDLGGVVATAVSACTHLVTDKFRRTVKSLCCIGRGTPIIDVSWIRKCRESKAFVDHAAFLLRDKKAEKSLNFSLSETLAQAAAHGGVLRGWNIHATARVQPPPRDMKEIVTCAGGKYLDAMPTRSTTSGNTIIVSCKDDAKACARAKNNGVPIVSAEFVLSGLLQYKVDVDTHRLD
ncbi:hypothetical protein V5799_022972 [Amblyomma americanum]|uniref:Mediator of DNA damage checkpoint protein 1 n=1 Tax=Amblyomma americanum TaxID=6943 RepID=A0AAQ4FJ87_AMBAM